MIDEFWQRKLASWCVDITKIAIWSRLLRTNTCSNPMLFLNGQCKIDTLYTWHFCYLTKKWFTLQLVQGALHFLGSLFYRIVYPAHLSFLRLSAVRAFHLLLLMASATARVPATYSSEGTGSSGSSVPSGTLQQLTKPLVKQSIAYADPNYW